MCGSKVYIIGLLILGMAMVFAIDVEDMQRPIEMYTIKMLLGHCICVSFGIFTRFMVTTIKISLHH